ncbi:MAG: LON peptidase substrate-binding domain-containing protein, partial [Clostridia bacterium]|nr:LON peptidase substrate-binding domain-containing protein [Clostridia bacterium]
MPDYTEKIEQFDLPMVVLRGVTAFPSVTINFELSENENIAAVRAANAGNGFVLLVTSKGADSRVNPDDIYRVGTAAKIKQSINDGSGSMRVIAEGFSRASVVGTCRAGGYYEARVICKTLTLEDNGGIKGEAYVREARAAFENILKYFPSLSDDIILSARTIKNPGLLADFIASNVMIRTEDKQEILECFEPLKRVERLIVLLGREEQLLECELGIHQKVRARIGDGQRERYLREQMRAIEEELGEVAEEDEYYDKIIAAKLPKEVEEKLLKENDHMAKAQFGSAEATVIRNYLDVCLELPWNKETTDRIDIAAAKKILDADHYGLEKVKERILEFLAVKKLNPELKSQIICLVGPPGTGKTSVAKSIAAAMKRKYVRVSLGGVRDEADIRGHRKTYVAAMPGRIMTALATAKVKNPLMLLDEIDKLGNDSRGDPSSALLEALDPEQNKYFRDHFVELPFDLSGCLFVCTANTLEGVPRPLIDRMEIIELSGYTRREKLYIAKDHLLKKQMKRHGLNARTLKLDDGAIYEIIDYYTHEAGVRNLEREIAAVCRKAAVEIVQEKAKKVVVTKDNIEKYLGVRKFISEKLADADEVGV